MVTLGFIDSRAPEMSSVAPRTNLATGFINPEPLAFNVAVDNLKFTSSYFNSQSQSKMIESVA